jgi:hypothetical protein
MSPAKRECHLVGRADPGCLDLKNEIGITGKVTSVQAVRSALDVALPDAF